MGIQGLLPQLKSIMSPITVAELRGQRVAVDTYSWLHKGAFSCSRELCKGIPTSRHIDYCMHRVNLLRHHGIKPVLIFDGGMLPVKAEQETKRERARKENLERALEHEALGNSGAAYDCYQKAVDISPSIAFQLIQVLKQEKVDYIVAPYEADAQMAFLSKNKLVDAVISEDSDLIPFGCSRIIFKMDKFGEGIEFRSSKLEKNKDLDFSGFSGTMLLEMCIFSGCDYLQSLPGMGVKRAHALVLKFKNHEKVIKHLRYSSVVVPQHYEEDFKKAMWGFQHQTVYDPIEEDLAHLYDIPDGLCLDTDFLGPWLPRDVAKGIAEGVLDPITQMPFEGEATSVQPAQHKSYSAKDFAISGVKKKLDLPVQKNVLTNYFCMASLEARRKFLAPRVSRQSNFIEEEAAVAEATDELQPSLQQQLDGNEQDFKDPCSSLEAETEARNPLCGSPPSEDRSGELQSYAARGLDNPENRKVITKSKYFLNKSAGAEEHSVQQPSGGHSILNSCPLSRSAALLRSRSFGSSGTKRKRALDALKGSSSMPEAEEAAENDQKEASSSLQTEGGGGGGGGSCSSTDVWEEKSFGCDMSHLDKYSAIAEDSLGRFAALVSSFRYKPPSSAGSRASGLRRPPLRDVQNTRVMDK